jgi:hypothetical protein
LGTFFSPGFFLNASSANRYHVRVQVLSGFSPGPVPVTEFYPFIREAFAAPFPSIPIFPAKSPGNTGFGSGLCRVPKHQTTQDKIQPQNVPHFLIKRQTIG